MSNLPGARALYLQNGEDPIFAIFHEPPPEIERGSAVLICPPFGWEDVCSYRSRRDWAEQLALAGHPTLRIDFPGTGDSAGSPRDPHRLRTWAEAVRTSASWLAETSPEGRVAAIGIGFGGLVLCCGIGAGAPIDDAVLWGVGSRGRTFIRELSAFERMEAAKMAVEEDSEPPPTASEIRHVGGYALSVETTEDLQRLDLAELDLSSGRLTRALLLERDGIRVDAELRELLLAAGATVDVEPGPGYGDMMVEPAEARPPLAVFAHVEKWLKDTSSSPPARLHEQALLRPSALEAIELSIGDSRIRELPIRIKQEFGDLFGILSEPVGGPQGDFCALILNAGATRRIGPNRMWVELARRWAAQGVPALRLDVEGIGDADGDSERLTELAQLYVPGLVDQAIVALDELERRGLGQRFVCIGLCSGAYWSFHAALRDQRVAAALMLNPQALSWDASLEPIRKLRRALMHPSSWDRLLHGRVSRAQLRPVLRQAPRALSGSTRRRLQRLRARHENGDELDRAFDRLAETDKYLLMAFSDEEPLHYELAQEGRLERLERLENVELRALPGRDHTLRPAAAQRRAHEALDRGLARVLDHERQRALNGAS
jgi:pimeloyl-ACP methyl ester carboxylesterase